MSELLHYVTDRQRHLVCLPYSIDNLHRMADELGIRRHWMEIRQITKTQLTAITK